MGYQRFFTGFCLGLVLIVCIACSERILLSQASPSAAPSPAIAAPITTAPATALPNPAPARSEAAAVTAPTLSAEAQALVASAGPGGLLNPPRKDMRLVVISDLNSAYGSTTYDPEVDKAISLLPFWQPDLVVCGGDMVAGQDRRLTLDQFKAMWQAFDDHVAGPLRRQNLPFGFTVGNHDASSAMGANNSFLFQRERDLAAAYWRDPAHNPGVNFIDRSAFPFFYTFKQGDIFFMAWDGSSSRLSADQLAWVERSLASDVAQQAKARIVLGHLPLYGIAVGRDQPGEVLNNADQLRRLLERYRVHTYISGHQHAYYPGHSGQLQLLHAGILGSGPRPLIDSDRAPWKGLTVVDIDFSAPDLTTYTTYDIRSLRTVEPTELPRFLAGHNGLVLRRDISYADLTPAEKSVCTQRLGNARCTGGLSVLKLKTYAA
ncbi:MAG: metallophosphoesterase [Leptolyngbya sp. DLM2.Bin27]|nr:MAG: metallophosphoesterase [Leptolyngbya sp. DLM2.Bin27]